MKISSAFPSKYLKAADLDGREVKVVMSTVDTEEIQTEHGREERPVLYFQGKTKGLVLNITNGNAIADAYGDETEDWAGRVLVLYVARVQFKTKMVDAIRIKIPEQKSAARPQPQKVIHDERNPPPVETLADEMDDEIPF